jgi:hypothetical protein
MWLMILSVAIFSTEHCCGAARCKLRYQQAEEVRRWRNEFGNAWKNNLALNMRSKLSGWGAREAAG